jgi:3-dehydroquinate synthase
MQKVTVNVSRQPYQVLIEAGLLRQAGNSLRKLFGDRRHCVVVTVSPLRRRWGRVLASSLKTAKFDFAFLEMPDGERHKRLATVERLAEQLVRLGTDRKTTIIAFGGGVVGDTVGLLASLYMRGVDVVQIPTTLLAQVDAAIGGKTGVDLKEGKNLVGTFHHPRVVLIDTDVLSTLPPREFRAGLYESLKCGVIGNAKLFEEIESGKPVMLRRNAKSLGNIVTQSVKLKAQIVSADEREDGLRRVLNFGHTIGHALETESGYRRFLHGEAVAWGMIAATRLAAATNRIDLFSARRIINAVHGIGPLPSVTASGKKILRLMRADKKTTDGVIHFVLPTKIGRVEITNDIPEELIVAAVDELRESPGK